MKRFKYPLALLFLCLPALALCDDPPADENSAIPARKPQSQDPPGMTRLDPQYDAWLDPTNKRVVFDGSVCLRDGALEMLVCPRGTKEHEAIIAADTKAYLIHAALLAAGAEAGAPATFRPVYKAATGDEIDVDIIWTDSEGKVHRDKGQDWIKNAKTGEAMKYPWVFAGSGFWKDEITGRQVYMADTGDFVCVSNFPSSMLDLPVESSADNEDLMFRAFTERIPPLGTRVRVVLTPKPKQAAVAPDNQRSEHSGSKLHCTQTTLWSGRSSFIVR